MPINSLILRIVAAGLPIVIIALVAGAAGYATKGTKTAAIPPLAPAEPRPEAVRGDVQSFANDQLTIVGPDGTTRTFNLPGESAIEQLRPITAGELSMGDWINGGAIQHAQSVLALVGLVLISDPVIDTP